jgi:hypothetical protein
MNPIFGVIAAIGLQRHGHIAANFQQGLAQVPHMLQPMARDIWFKNKAVDVRHCDVELPTSCPSGPTQSGESLAWIASA